MQNFLPYNYVKFLDMKGWGKFPHSIPDLFWVCSLKINLGNRGTPFQDIHTKIHVEFACRTLNPTFIIIVSLLQYTNFKLHDEVISLILIQSFMSRPLQYSKLMSSFIRLIHYRTYALNSIKGFLHLKMGISNNFLTLGLEE